MVGKMKGVSDMKERLKVEELEENIEELKGVAQDVFPALVFTVIVSSVLLFIFLLRLYIRWGAECPSKNRMDGKTVIVTGANTGLGKATAVELAKRGARVYLACRDKVKGEAVARGIRKKTGNQNVFAARLDLASLRSIKEFADDFIQNEAKLHVLINNAAYLGPKAATDDGFERSLGVNHLGHAYLTLLLMDKLKKCAPSRVINVVSDSYVRAKIDFDDLPLARGYDPYSAYARSKLAQTVFNLECHRHFFSGCVWNFAVHPGACCTDLLRNYPGMYGNLLRVAARVLFKSPEEGCQTIVYCAVADGLRDFSGKLFANCKVVKLNEVARDKQLGKRLWNTTLHLCGLENEFFTYPDDEEAAQPTENGSQVISTESPITAESDPGVTGPEKRTAAQAPTPTSS
ncbi:retinol dehydrogenase 12-like [Pomacea canaliculata]|uniref:retinol dehydrogenase 12-like n=1 Tax=Pomacea canaliculata TaxID=400727 RepID=UPI000D72DE60|nr:retinol dehydrogenase 12-like [Pomacea canaliculata]